MKRIVMLVALLCGALAVGPAMAQKTAPAVTRDTDRDGVPDTRDRCRNTERGARVGADGCPAAGASAPPTPANPAGPPQSAANRPNPAPGGPPAASPAPAPVVTAPVQQQAQAPNTPATSQPSRPNPGDSVANANRPPAGVTAPVVNPPVSRPDSSAPANNRANRPSGLPTPVVPPPAAAPAPAPAPARQPSVDSSVTAGFWMPAYGGSSEADLLSYARSLVLRTDSAVNALVDVFRNTSGAPMAGATSPNVISSRERGRWDRCRLLHFDLRTLADAAAFLKDSLPGGPTLRRAIGGLDDAYQGLAASEECDNVVSMIQAPDRWTPWQQNYETSSRNFYRDWYAQLRAVHAANRTFVGFLNPRLGARAVPMPSALPPRPPTLGGM